MGERVMATDSYLQWLSQTSTAWWNDSGEPEQLTRALQHGATGVTTNPFLTNQALRAPQNPWTALAKNLPADLSAEQRAEALTGNVVRSAAKLFLPLYERSRGKQGYVCAQVNPNRAGDRPAMIAMAKRMHAWAPNITVKLPATAAGLDALEECTALGLSTTATVSFTVPQVIAVAERYRSGLSRARQAGHSPRPCFAVIMIGRLDDYLREVAADQQTAVSEDDIRCAGLAVTKRAYQIFRERGYEATLVVAALRGVHHMLGIAGGDLTMSLHPKIQDLLLKPDVPRTLGIDTPVTPEIVDRLNQLAEFRRAYQPDGMTPEEFITYGATQRTLSQFIESGWGQIEALQF